MLDQQLVLGAFAYAAHILIGELDLSAFNAHYRNDTTRASAYAPLVSLKAVLVAYAHGIVSSHGIERECRNSVLFTAPPGDAQPNHHRRLHLAFA